MRIFDIKSLGEVIFESEVPTRSDVAVVVPLYNHELFVIDCLQSVVDQTLERLSVVIVDDCSTDDGPELAAQFLRRHASRFCSARMVRHKRNQGLSMVRNSGVEWSAEPLLFMLDADNRIRPTALARLKSALDVDDADFAYSQIFIFGVETEVGCADFWHVDRLRDSNTIDAMAMIRRSALIKAGGYAVLATDQGYEVYDLWCKFYAMGLRGVFIPELLCEYRRHIQATMNTRPNLKLNQSRAEMEARHPEIFNFRPRTATVDEDLSVCLPLGYEILYRAECPRIAVVVHIFAEWLTDEILGYVENIPGRADLYISTDSEEKKIYIQERLRGLGRLAELRVTPRQGRDIAPRLIGFRDVYNRYEYVLLLHSKTSSHSQVLKNWRKHLLDNLLGSRKVVDSILEIFNNSPDVGIIAAQHFDGIRNWLDWGDNFENCKAFADRFGVELKSNGFLDYPSGSMFWARTAALRPFFDAKLVLDDFSPDSVARQIDGTMAHAIERLVFVAAEKAGFSWIKVAQPHLFERRDTIKQILSRAELHKFASKQRRILAPLRNKSAVGTGPGGAHDVSAVSGVDTKTDSSIQRADQNLARIPHNGAR
jgi:glycosyltransferase involved in cell wall biosynthesis